MKRLYSGFLAGVIGACAIMPAAAAETGGGFLVRNPAFELCELEGFSAHDTGRQAILFKATEEELLASTPDFRKPVVTELFGMIRNGQLKNHARFGSEHFHRCLEREKLSIAYDANSTAVCMARTDLAFFLYAEHKKGTPMEAATESIKKMVGKMPEVFPPAVIEQLAPMAYRAESLEDHDELRRFVFETCAVPDDWQAWWNSVNANKNP